MKFWDNVGDPSYFPTLLPDCLFHVSFSRYSPLSLEVVEKPNKCRSSLAPIFFRARLPQLFYGRLIARPTIHRLAKFGWVPFADLRLRSLAMKWNAEFTEVGENSRPIWSRLWTKVYVVLRQCRRLLVVCNAVARLCMSCFIQRPLKLMLSCEIVEKGGFLGPGFVGRRNTLDFGHAFSNRTYLRPCGRILLSSVHRARRLEGE